MFLVVETITFPFLSPLLPLFLYVLIIKIYINEGSLILNVTNRSSNFVGEDQEQQR